MRAGTQTLIQALQALPWMDSDPEDEHCEAESESDEEERPQSTSLCTSYMCRN